MATAPVIPAQPASDPASSWYTECQHDKQYALAIMIATTAFFVVLGIVFVTVGNKVVLGDKNPQMGGRIAMYVFGSLFLAYGVLGAAISIPIVTAPNFCKDNDPNKT
jgi:hypothetical protein